MTDYTFNPNLFNPAESAPWALGLDRRIVKIVLEGGQKGRARDLQPGAMYRIKNLRLINRTGVKGDFGRLGGDERLIIAADDRKEDVQALLQYVLAGLLTFYLSLILLQQTQGEVEVRNETRRGVRRTSGQFRHNITPSYSRDIPGSHSQTSYRQHRLSQHIHGRCAGDRFSSLRFGSSHVPAVHEVQHQVSLSRFFP